MDWAKAKTILIAVFLASNLFLAYMIIGANTGNSVDVDGEKIKLIIDYLAEKNITVKDQIPTKKTDMPSITVKYKLFKKEDIVEQIFSPEEKAAETVEGSTVKLKGSNIEVSIKDSRELYYTNSSIRPGTADEKACSKKIKEFLDRLGLKDDANTRRVEDLDGYKRFIYGQSFKGAPIYNSIMEFYVNDEGVQKARIVWFETIKQEGRKSAVISPVIALLALPQYNADNGAKGLEVLGVQQGYHFGTGAAGQVDTSKVEEGTAFPVWKITTNRDIIYINAYNEKVEGIEKRQ